MSQKLMIANLPPDITTDELTSLLEERGVEPREITLNNQGDATRILAVVLFDDMDRAGAERIAQRISGARFRDRTLNAYVPLFM